jgi:UDP:flavonoid glycosyltransferase YjiC (YdhE family)
VRALFSFAGGTGHALPLLPTARALVARGHEVLFTGQAGMIDLIRATGFEAVDSGGTTLASPSDRPPLVRPDREAERAVIRDVFAGRVAEERAARLLDVAREFGADVLVRDEVDFGAAVAAERLGIPHASVVVLASGGMIRPGDLDDALDRLRGRHGLPASPGFLDRYLTIAPLMPSFRDPRAPLPPRSLAVRPDVLAEPAADASVRDPVVARVDRWLAEQPRRPLVYFTLGTIFGPESGDLFDRVLRGVEQLSANVVVTVGREIDPAELGARGENVLIEQFVPQRALLPRAAVVVSHAGSGTVVSSLACGVPLVLLPLGADQPWNADRCTELGVGRLLDVVDASPEDVTHAVRDLLTDPAYRATARSLRDEAERLPAAEVAADAVADLVG